MFTFDELKKFAISILEDIKNDTKKEYKINSEKDLVLYADTLHSIIDGITNDTELQRLYYENQN